MKTFTFRVGKKTKTFQAARPVEAMGLANEHFKAFALPQGAWMDHGPANYYWAEGNFFD